MLQTEQHFGLSPRNTLVTHTHTSARLLFRFYNQQSICVFIFFENYNVTNLCFLCWLFCNYDHEYKRWWVIKEKKVSPTSPAVEKIGYNTGNFSQTFFPFSSSQPFFIHTVAWCNTSEFLFFDRVIKLYCQICGFDYALLLNIKPHLHGVCMFFKKAHSSF